MKILTAALLLTLAFTVPVRGAGGSPAGDAGTMPDALPVVTEDTNTPIVVPEELYSQQQTARDITRLKARYGDRMKVYAIGKSLDGRTIFDITVGNPEAEKKLLVTAAIHGREYITIPIAMQQLEALLADMAAREAGEPAPPDSGISVAELLTGVQVHFIPINNPDGVMISQFGELALYSDTLRANLPAAWQAEGQPDSYSYYLKRWKTNAAGVDPNLNFDAGWGYLESVGHPTAYGVNTGSAPFSEPESRCLMELCQREEFDAVISYHARGNVIYWDSFWNRAREASEDFAKAIGAVSGYDIQPSSMSAGGLKDWLQCRENPIPGVTIEVGASEAPVNFGEYASIWRHNRSVIPAALDWLAGQP